MKKILIGFLVVCLFVSTVACDDKALSNTSEDNAKKGIINIQKLDISPEDTSVRGQWSVLCPVIN